MFGGIAALGSDRIVYTTSDGHIVRFDAETGAVTGQQALYPVAPRRLHVAACTFDDRGDLLVADARHGLVRVVDPDGCQRERIGGLATPGVDREDSPGVLHEPCELLWTAENRLWVVCGGYELEHVVEGGLGLLELTPGEGDLREAQPGGEGVRRLGHDGLDARRQSPVQDLPPVRVEYRIAHVRVTVDQGRKGHAPSG